MKNNEALRDANPHLLTLDTLRVTLRRTDEELSLKLYETKRSLFFAIEAGRRDDAIALINTLTVIKEALPKNKQLAIAFKGIVDAVDGMDVDRV